MAKGGLYELTYFIVHHGRRGLYFYGESIGCDILCTIPGSHDEGPSSNQLVQSVSKSKELPSFTSDDQKSRQHLNM